MVVRALDLSPELHALLARVHELKAPRTRCAFTEPKLAAIEQALISVVPDAVLAVLLAQGTVLDRLVALTGERFDFAEATHGRSVAQNTKGRLIVLDSYGDWPRWSVGFRPTRDRTEPRLVTWNWKSWTELPRGDLGVGSVKVGDREPMRAYLLRRLGGQDADGAPLDLASPASEEALGRFRPVIEAQVPQPSRELFVLHPKFGRGRVLRENGEQLEIAFDSGKRTLLRRFVTEESP